MKKRIKNYSEKNPQTQRGCGCPIAGGVEGEVGWSPGQPGVVPDLEVGGTDCGSGSGT